MIFRRLSSATVAVEEGVGVVGITTNENKLTINAVRPARLLAILKKQAHQYKGKRYDLKAKGRSKVGQDLAPIALRETGSA